VVLVASIPGYPDTDPVELVPEVCTTVYHVVHTVTIALESGASQCYPFSVTISGGTWSFLEMQSTSDTAAYSSLVSLEIPTLELRRTHTLVVAISASFTSQAVMARMVFSLPAAPTRPDPTRPDPTRRSGYSLTQESINALQAVNISFLPFLRPAPPSFEISRPGLLRKKVPYLYVYISPRVGYSAPNSGLALRNTNLDDERTLSDYNIGSVVPGAPSPSIQRRWPESP